MRRHLIVHIKIDKQNVTKISNNKNYFEYLTVTTEIFSNFLNVNFSTKTI